jgi:hypothetical protein
MNLRRQIDYNQSVGSPAPNIVAARTTYLKFFQCPSEPNGATDFVASDGGTGSWQLAHGSYVACNGNDGVDDFTTPPHTGAFVRGRRGFRIPEFTDGVSNTFFVGERCTTMSWSTWVGVIPGSLDPSIRSPGDFSGGSAFVLGHCGPHLPNDGIVTDADAMSSGHPGGVQFLLGDGSVRQINNSISVNVYDALATRDAGDVVGSDD